MKRSEQQQTEKWRSVDGYEGLYEVSNLGRIRSLVRSRVMILQSKVEADSYLRVTLYKNGTKKNYTVHRMVAEAFIPNPNGYPQVNHKDGDIHNSNIDNLEWCTPKQNAIHARDVLGKINMPHLGKTGVKCHSSIPVVQKEKTGKIVRKWDAMADAERHGFDRGCITRCCKGEYKSHKGYVWEYYEQNRATK